MERIVPRCVGSDHGIKYGQKLAHAGNQRDLGQFAGGLQALIEGFDGRIVAGGGEGGHVKAGSFKQLRGPRKLLFFISSVVFFF